MSLNYTVADFTEEDIAARVTYTNEVGKVHIRDVRIPRTSEGTLDEDLWNQILSEQLEGLKRKIEVGAASFVDPNVLDDITSSEVVEDGPPAPGDD